MSTMQQTMRGLMGQEVIADPWARRFVVALAFVLATSFGAYVAVWLPFTPVPVTLQPLFVILSGAVLGSWGGAAAMASYVILGAAGAPVFSSGHSGLPWLMGMTGGYLLAYPAAAFAVGALRGSHPGALRSIGALTIGIALIYLGGVSQLWILTRQDLGTLLAQGVLPFLPGDLLKILVAHALAHGLRRTSLGRL